MKITVAVPTIAGRGAYLASCLKTCVTQDEDFEILVSDNPGAEARGVVDALNDPRIRYIRPPNYLPMSAHWDFVIGQASGDLLTFIGDDDGLMPGCVRRVREIRGQVGDLPIQHALANYYWPDFINQSLRGKVLFHHSAGWGRRVVQSRDYLSSVSLGTGRYLDGPMAYHNFIPMALLRRLSVDGKFFRRAAPDIYSAMAVAMNVDAFFSTDELLTISGQGSKANGAAVQSGGGDSFMAEAQACYPPRFPGRSVQMAVTDALIEAAEHFGRQDILSEIDYGGHYAALVGEIRNGMPESSRRTEMRFAWQAAKSRGAVLATALRLIERKVRPERQNRRTAEQAFSQGEVIRLMETVGDIAAAALCIDTLLAAAEFNQKPITPPSGAADQVA